MDSTERIPPEDEAKVAYLAKLLQMARWADVWRSDPKLTEAERKEIQRIAGW